MLNITNYKKNANQTTTSLLSHNDQNGHQRVKIKAEEGVEKREPSNKVGGNVNWCGNYGKQYRVSLKNKTKNSYHMI